MNYFSFIRFWFVDDSQLEESPLVAVYVVYSWWTPKLLPLFEVCSLRFMCRCIIAEPLKKIFLGPSLFYAVVLYVVPGSFFLLQFTLAFYSLKLTCRLFFFKVRGKTYFNVFNTRTGEKMSFFISFINIHVEFFINHCVKSAASQLLVWVCLAACPDPACGLRLQLVGVMLGGIWNLGSGEWWAVLGLGAGLPGLWLPGCHGYERNLWMWGPGTAVTG